MREGTDYLGQSNVKSTSMERKLSTILASDVVGFSKMMASNEESTLGVLRKRRQVIDGVIAEHAGTIFGSAGDSVIAEFASPIKATECAVQIQSKMQAMNEDVPEDQQMVFRVGINIGDVMVSKDNLFGDAVNVAARLESAAKPSGICISKSVFDMVRQKIKVSFEDAGELELKILRIPYRHISLLRAGAQLATSTIQTRHKSRLNRPKLHRLPLCCLRILVRTRNRPTSAKGFLRI